MYRDFSSYTHHCLSFLSVAARASDRPVGGELLQIIVSLEKNYANLAKVHYLRFLYHRDQYEWELAVDCLHLYFDYCYCHIDRKGDHVSSGVITRNPGIVPSYCLLNLAALHYHFRHLDTAVEMIHSLISNAQERNEHECLVLAFALLYRISQDQGATQKATLELVQRCKKRAEELGMHELVSETYVASAKLTVLTNSKLLPSEIENVRVHFLPIPVQLNIIDQLS